MTLHVKYRCVGEKLIPWKFAGVMDDGKRTIYNFQAAECEYNEWNASHVDSISAKLPACIFHDKIVSVPRIFG